MFNYKDKSIYIPTQLTRDHKSRNIVFKYFGAYDMGNPKGVWHGESKGHMAWRAQAAYSIGNPRGIWHGESKGHMAWGMQEAYGMGKFFSAMVIVFPLGLGFHKNS
jgi:hypothetical protein